MNLEFREPCTIEELESLLRLRFKVYAEDPLLNKMVLGYSSHDISGFDLNALHFGGFDGEKPVAYLRMVTTTETYFANWVRCISAVQQNQDYKFPFQIYCADKSWSYEFIESLKGKKIGEVGKLAIDPEYRNGGVVLTKLFESFIPYCKEKYEFDTGFGSCVLPLERYYRKFGFKRAKGAEPFAFTGLPEAVMVQFDR